MRQFFARLRSPRYAIALLFGVAYFFFVFGGPALFGRHARKPGPANESRATLTTFVGYVAPVMLAILVSAYWLLGNATQALTLSPAEANLLVPAPITRRRLIQYKLLTTQPGILWTAAIMTMMLRMLPIAWYLRFPSLWMMFTILQYHQIGATLVHAGLQHQGGAAWRRVWPATLLFTVAFVIVVEAIVRAAKGMRAAIDGPAIIAVLDGVFQHAPVSLVLAPFNAVVAPIRAENVSAWLSSFAIAALVLAAHYVWVIRSDAAFEEGAVEAGAKRAAALEAARLGKRVSLLNRRTRGVRKPLFALRPMGEPAYGIWWKNVLQFTRAASPIVVLIVLLLPAGLGAIDYADSHSLQRSLVTTGTIMLILAGFSVLIAPIVVRNDLRSDLRRIELLRTLPVRGTRLVTAEIAAASATVVSMQLVAAGAGAFLVLVFGHAKHKPIIIGMLLPIALFVIAINLIMLLIQNALVLLFPGWVRPRTAQPGGIEFLGQNVMIMLTSMVIFVLALIAPILAAAATAGPMVVQMGKLAAVPAITVFLASLFLEIWAGVVWLGQAYDNIDPVEAGLCQ